MSMSSGAFKRTGALFALPVSESGGAEWLENIFEWLSVGGIRAEPSAACFDTVKDDWHAFLRVVLIE